MHNDVLRGSVAVEMSFARLIAPLLDLSKVIHPGDIRKDDRTAGESKYDAARSWRSWKEKIGRSARCATSNCRWFSTQMGRCTCTLPARMCPARTTLAYTSRVFTVQTTIIRMATLMGTPA